MRLSTRQTILALLLVAALAIGWTGTVDTVAKRSTEEGFQRALATFAVARGFNAILSLAQSASINVQFIAGMQISPGALLDPIDDMVEQFSTVMMVATASFAAQRLLIEIGGAWPVNLALTLASVGWLAFALRRRMRGDPEAPSWLARVAIALLFLRFAVPAVALASEATYRLVMASTYEAAQAKVKAAESVEPDAPRAESRLERLKRWLSDKTEVAERVEQLRARLDGAVEHLIRLTAVFVVQTIVLPLLFLWLVLRLARMAMPLPEPRPPPRLPSRKGEITVADRE